MVAGRSADDRPMIVTSQIQSFWPVTIIGRSSADGRPMVGGWSADDRPMDKQGPDMPDFGHLIFGPFINNIW